MDLNIWGDDSYYERKCENLDEQFQSVCAEAIGLARKFGNEEKRSLSCVRINETSENNITSEMIKECWQESGCLIFLYDVLPETESRLSQEKRAYSEPGIILKVLDEKREKLGQLMRER